MKVAVVLLAIFAIVYAIDAVGEGHSEAPDQVVNPPNWHGSWTAGNRYGGVMYACPQGNRVYGVYSNAGFFIARTEGRNLEGNWWEGGRGDRNDYQGSFSITVSADNQEFDGYWNRVSTDGEEYRWHEHRLGAPYPSNPTNIDCLTPVDEYVMGAFFRRPTGSATAASYHICKDEYDQIYGSFQGPDGYVEGWSVDRSSGFHGYRYDSDGRSGAYILRSISTSEVRGFYWRGRLAAQNIETATEEVLDRSSYISDLDACQSVGPGFLRRLRGPLNPANSAASLGLSLIVVLGALLVLF